jgi:hypothetical protein
MLLQVSSIILVLILCKECVRTSKIIIRHFQLLGSWEFKAGTIGTRYWHCKSKTINIEAMHNPVKARNGKKMGGKIIAAI